MFWAASGEFTLPLVTDPPPAVQGTRAHAKPWRGHWRGYKGRCPSGALLYTVNQKLKQWGVASILLQSLRERCRPSAGAMPPAQRGAAAALPLVVLA